MSDKESLLKRLCHYYLACLSQENHRELSVFASTYQTPDYLELPSWPLLKDSDFSFANLKIDTLYRKPDTKRRKLNFLLGFPVNYRKFYTKNSKNPVYKVEPIFVYRIEIDQNKIVSYPEANEPPILNTAVFDNSWKLSNEAKASERVDIELFDISAS